MSDFGYRGSIGKPISGSSGVAATPSTPGKLPWEAQAPAAGGGTQGGTYYPINPLGPYSGPLGTAPPPSSTPTPGAGSSPQPFGLGSSWLSSLFGGGNGMQGLLDQLRQRYGQSQTPAPQAPAPQQPQPQQAQYSPPNLITRPYTTRYF